MRIRLTALLLFALAPDLAAQRDTLAPIVVTATRTAEPVSALANPVTVLDGDALRRAGVATVAEALRGVPSLVLAQAGSYGAQTSMFLRGGESDYVRVLVDGVPLNQPGGAIDVANLTTENVERIEIVRGPTSVLYGSDAVTGVIQVFTRRGMGPARVAAEARVGERGSSLASVEASWGGARAGLSGGAQREATDGIHPFNSHYDNLAASARFWTRPDTRSDIQVSARFRNGTFHFPTDGGGAVTDSNALGSSRQLAASVDAGRWLGSRVELRALLTGAISRDSSDNQPDSPGDSLDFYSESRRNTRRLGADLRANVRLATALALTAGAAIEGERTRDRGSYTSSFGSGVTPESTLARGNRAVYVQAVTSGARWSIQAGARLDDNERFGAHGTWRAGVSAWLTPSTRLRVNGGTAFKEPTFDEVFNTAFSTGNPDLAPEQSLSGEAGVEQRLGRSRVAATLFHQRFRNLIEYGFGAGPGGSDFRNVGSATASGLETEIHVAPVSGVVLTAQHTWLRTEAADSSALLRRPRHSASVSGEWTGATGHGAGVRVQHVGRRDDLYFGGFSSTKVRMPDYTLLAVWARFTLLRSRSGRSALSLTARAENLLNKHYQDLAGFDAPGRRLMIGARVDAGAQTR